MECFFVDPDIFTTKTLNTDFYTEPVIFEESKVKNIR
jgi:hypothetical protein